MGAMQRENTHTHTQTANQTIISTRIYTSASTHSNLENIQIIWYEAENDGMVNYFDNIQIIFISLNGRILGFVGIEKKNEVLLSNLTVKLLL